MVVLLSNSLIAMYLIAIQTVISVGYTLKFIYPADLSRDSFFFSSLYLNYPHTKGEFEMFFCS